MCSKFPEWLIGDMGGNAFDAGCAGAALFTTLVFLATHAQAAAATSAAESSLPSGSAAVEPDSESDSDLDDVWAVGP